ncbi:MAG: 3-deoxy-7-phosphoheptulonate synthase [Deltaproteobacteria bacterium]|nr:3-deoxy-7-phosphoheptulonate synthase [Deltaproteobacteria bacterium]
MNLDPQYIYSLFIKKNNFSLIAGPCAVESEHQLDSVASFLSSLDIKLLRGGTFKPRTDPSTFQGLGFEGLSILNKAGKKFQMYTITEIQDTDMLNSGTELSDIIQVGARSMHNYSLLKALGNMDKVIILKRGFGSTVQEWIGAAQYISNNGNNKIVMCERGIRTFSDSSRFTLDLASVIRLKNSTPWPVIVDPSHAAGDRNLVSPLALGALGAGADGLIIEVHNNPEAALSDGSQSLTHEMFTKLHSQIKLHLNCFGKKIV